jgi:hypothetical protein
MVYFPPTAASPDSRDEKINRPKHDSIMSFQYLPVTKFQILTVSDHSAATGDKPIHI